MSKRSTVNNGESYGLESVDVNDGKWDRSLNDDELAELGRLERIIKVKPRWIALPLTLWFWPMFIASVVNRRFPSDPFMIFSLSLLGVMTVYWEWQVFHGARVAALLRKDLESRVVVTAVEVGAADGAVEREILPKSMMAWTVNGEPAPWRGHPPTDTRPNSLSE